MIAPPATRIGFRACEEPEEGYDPVRSWEIERLLDLGFDPAQALRLASVPGLSWHDAERLLRRGMPHAYVVEELT